MKEGNVIEVKDVKKRFKSYTDKAFTLKERLIRPSRNMHEDIWVLKDINFEVKKGEAVGLIGKNGCGKSTMLKLLTHILYPNGGIIDMKGKVSSLIELGAGFHPDMTGRENIYTNASIFGIKRKEVDKRLNDIIRFSELEEFIDNPVRTYSSGMYTRLAFAVAINVDADILLIDEILAVGDSAFQKKCFEKLKKIKENGTSIIIVSHSMEQMYKICDKLIWIEDGTVRKEGVPQRVGEEYLDEMEGRRLTRIDVEQQQRKIEIENELKRERERIQKEEEKRRREEEKRKKEDETRNKIEMERQEKNRLEDLDRQRLQIEKNETLKLLTKFYRAGARRSGDEQIIFTKISISDENRVEKNVFMTGEKIVIEMEYRAKKDSIPAEFVICFTREDGVYCYGATTFLELNELVKAKKEGLAEFVIESNKLLGGKYLLDFRIRKNKEELYDNIFSLLELEVKNTEAKESGIFSMPHYWKIDGNILPKIEYKN